MTCISRRRFFQRLHPDGRILTPKGAAHNYYVEVSLAGRIDPDSGMFLNIREIDTMIDEAWAAAEGPFSSSARLAEFLFERLSGPARARGAVLSKLRLFESADFWVDVWP